MKQSNRKMNRKISPFVTKLLNILQDPKSQNCVSWQTDDSFVIVDSDEFSQNVLSKYFKHSNFSSFIRQLNIYGFQKIKTQQNHHYYHHKNLIRNNRKQLRLIQRKLKKNMGSENSSQIIPEKVKTFKKSKQMEGLLNQLKEENKKIKQENSNLNKIIQQIKQENKKQVGNLLNFLNFMLQNQKIGGSQCDKNQAKKTTMYETGIRLLNNELNQQMKEQNRKIAVNYQKIFRLLNCILQQKNKQQKCTTQQNQGQQMKDIEMQNISKVCRSQENKNKYDQNQMNFEDPHSGLDIDNFF